MGSKNAAQDGGQKLCDEYLKLLDLETLEAVRQTNLEVTDLGYEKSIFYIMAKIQVTRKCFFA